MFVFGKYGTKVWLLVLPSKVIGTEFIDTEFWYLGSTVQFMVLVFSLTTYLEKSTMDGQMIFYIFPFLFSSCGLCGCVG